MAFIVEQNKKENEGQLGNPQSGQSAFIGGGQTPASAGSKPPTVGSGFTNLDKYLSVNEGTGAGIANAVTADADKKVGTAVSQINDWQSKASNVDKSQGNQLEGFKSQIANDPTKVNAGLFQKSLNAGYNNPTQANATTGYGEAYNAFNGAKDSFQRLAKDDWSSRASQVTDTFKQTNPSYNRGSAILDAFVAQGDKKGQEAFKSFTDKNASVFAQGNDAFTKASSGVQSALDTEKNRYQMLAGTGAGSVKQAINDKRAGINQQIDQRYATPASNAQSVGALGGMLDKYLGDFDNSRKNLVHGERPDAQINEFRQGLGKYVTANSAYDRSDVINDVDEAALNSLAGLDGGETVRRGTDSAFVTNAPAMERDWKGLLDKYWNDQAVTHYAEDEEERRRQEIERINNGG